MENDNEKTEKDLSGIIQKNRKLSGILKYAGIIAIILGVAITILTTSQLTFRQITSDLNLKTDEMIISALKESNAKMSARKEREEEVTLLVNEFLNARNGEIYPARYFTDTVSRYYSKSNVPLDRIRNEKAPSILRNQDKTLSAGRPEISVSLNDSTGAEVFVTRGETLLQIKLDANNRIYFIRYLVEK